MAKLKRKDKKTQQEARQVLVRMPDDEHEALRTYAFVTDRTVNDVVRHAVREFITGEGRREEIDAIVQRIRKARRGALDKLRDL